MSTPSPHRDLPLIGRPIFEMERKRTGADEPLLRPESQPGVAVSARGLRRGSYTWSSVSRDREACRFYDDLTVDIASARSSTDRSRPGVVGAWWATMSSSAPVSATRVSRKERTSRGVPTAV